MGKIDPLVLLKLLHVGIDNRAAGGLGVERRKIRLRRKLAHDLRSAAGIDDIVHKQLTVAVAVDTFEDFHTRLRLRFLAGLGGKLARYANRVHESDVELAGDQSGGHWAITRDDDDAVRVKELGKVVGVAAEFGP